MRPSTKLVLIPVLAGATLFASVPGAAAAGYDFSNPTSTGCTKKGQVDVPATVRTYGPWQIRLKRSTGCNTVWARITRTDTKKCGANGVNCAMVRITRDRVGGTRTATAWRRTPRGTKAVLSLQLSGLPSSAYSATFSTFGGTPLGTSGTLRSDANGDWSAS
ncbi:MAG: hypothetical protein ACXVJX_01725 [Acidimicrobiia bacterium]